MTTDIVVLASSIVASGMIGGSIWWAQRDRSIDYKTVSLFGTPDEKLQQQVTQLKKRVNRLEYNLGKTVDAVGVLLDQAKRGPGVRDSSNGRKGKKRAVGTPDYLAPELLLGTGDGPEVDWWSLGAVLYEFVTGVPPFNADTPEAIFENILSRNISWPEELSPECQDLIEGLLCLEPQQRLGHRGSGEVKLHPWFADLNWGTLARSKAAFIPTLESDTDVSYFQSRKPVSYASMVMDTRAVTSNENSQSSTPHGRRLTEATHHTGSFSSATSSRHGGSKLTRGSQSSRDQLSNHSGTQRLAGEVAESWRRSAQVQQDLEQPGSEAAPGTSSNSSPGQHSRSPSHSSSGTTSASANAQAVQFSNFSFKNLEALGARNREAAAEMQALRGTPSQTSPSRWAAPWLWSRH